MVDPFCTNQSIKTVSSACSSNNNTNNSCTKIYTCIITDLTEASNTCKRHAISLSGAYKLECLIKEAARFYSYDEFTFNLMWKSSNNRDFVNLSELLESDLLLENLDLSATGRNFFEIHEKDDGPPKKLKAGGDSSSRDYEEDRADFLGCPFGQQRRNACVINNEPIIDLTSESCSSGPLVEYASAHFPSSSSADQKMFPEEETSGYVGLINQAMTCYLNSLLQTLFMTPEFRNAIYKWKPSQEILQNEETMLKSIPFQLQRLFVNLQTTRKKSIHTKDLTKSFGWNSEDAFQQHDVQELCRVMFDALEKTFCRGAQANLINELYQGKIKDYVKCCECEKESAREDVYSDVPLCVRPFGAETFYESVQEALDAFVQPEILDYSNKYFCSKCEKSCKAHKGLKFVSFPYILSLQLKRFDFDYKTLSRFKLSNRISFPDTLDLRKYLHEHEDGAEFDEPLTEYELFSVMIHSGSATGGHYFAYIKSFETNEWLNFNDEKVSRLEKQEIEKAYGTSFSSYSSTTAYMLFYRRIDPKRNEKFIVEQEFDEHLKQLLIKEREKEKQDNDLKEYMENVCKIKILLPAQNHHHSNGACFSVQRENTVELHKDLTLLRAKEEIVKYFELESYLRDTKQKCRILKYDTENDFIDHSYANESTLTVFEALGFTKLPCNICWYLDIQAKDKEFIQYAQEDLNLKVIGLNIDSLETRDLLNLRISNECSVFELQNLIGQKLRIAKEKIRLVLERPHTVFNYYYLNASMSEKLKSLRFHRVNKLFIDYEDDCSALKRQFDAEKFEFSRFYYALDTLSNLLRISVYLPDEERCELFLKKLKRRLEYSGKCLNSNASSRKNECNNLVDFMQNMEPVKSIGEPISKMHKSDNVVCDDEEMESRVDEEIGSSGWVLSARNTKRNNSSNLKSDVLALNMAGPSPIRQKTEAENDLYDKDDDKDDDDDDLEVNIGGDSELNNLDDFLENDEQENSNYENSEQQQNDYQYDGCETSPINKFAESSLKLDKKALSYDSLNAEQRYRFIRSNLVVNSDLGTRTLEVKMDRRIELDYFKQYISDHVKILPAFIRVFCMSQTDDDCEPTEFENQFGSIAQMSKFFIKLGPPPKSGQRILAVHKLNKSKGNFTYLCEFMIVNGLSVHAHKELLSFDLRDECELQIPVANNELEIKFI